MSSEAGAVTITGAGGFIGRNLSLRLAEHGRTAIPIGRESSLGELREALARSDAVFHLAGANRPRDSTEFMAINGDFTALLANEVTTAGRRPLVIYASSSRAEGDDDYGRSKRAGEEALQSLGRAATISAWRLPNVFGKWARPNYNSVVATFCHNLARGLAIKIDNPATELRLIYIDDLLDQWMELLEGDVAPPLAEPVNVHATTLGELAETLERMAAGRPRCEVERVGSGLERALYATYLSYLPPGQFSYPLVAHKDERGAFMEFLRTRDSGQVAVLRAFPGQTRGRHYHHTKAEKMLVVQGQALFRFRHIEHGDFTEVRASADDPIAVESIPGWAHDVTNIGDQDLIVLVWASEAFDRLRPDTVAATP
jgi:UDP-2-acetamido-2,6-beta-L-arabino-hexul-4-ose reductase